jgi:hypothetical protein
MSRTQESGAYFGGIGAMLEAADVCPSCGRVHSDRQFGLRHGDRRDCPEVVMGSFPVISMPEPLEVLLVTPNPKPAAESRRLPPSVPPVHLGALPAPSRTAELRSRSNGVPWLRPPDLEEVL